MRILARWTRLGAAFTPPIESSVEWVFNVCIVRGKAVEIVYEGLRLSDLCPGLGGRVHLLHHISGQRLRHLVQDALACNTDQYTWSILSHRTSIVWGTVYSEGLATVKLMSPSCCSNYREATCAKVVHVCISSESPPAASTPALIFSAMVLVWP